MAWLPCSRGYTNRAAVAEVWLPAEHLHVGPLPHRTQAAQVAIQQGIVRSVDVSAWNTEEARREERLAARRQHPWRWRGDTRRRRHNRLICRERGHRHEQGTDQKG